MVLAAAYMGDDLVPDYCRTKQLSKSAESQGPVSQFQQQFLPLQSGFGASALEFPQFHGFGKRANLRSHHRRNLRMYEPWDPATVTRDVT
jgi:hypothetical protein